MDGMNERFEIYAMFQRLVLAFLMAFCFCWGTGASIFGGIICAMALFFLDVPRFRIKK